MNNCRWFLSFTLRRLQGIVYRFRTLLLVLCLAIIKVGSDETLVKLWFKRLDAETTPHKKYLTNIPLIFRRSIISCMYQRICNFFFLLKNRYYEKTDNMFIISQ